MKKLTVAQLGKISFPDCEVEEMILDIDNKQLLIKMDGAWLDLDHGGKELSNCNVKVTNWSSLDIRMYTAGDDEWIKLSEDNFDKLVDICEFEFGDNIIFRGFGSGTGQWIEYIFGKAELFVEVK